MLRFKNFPIYVVYSLHRQQVIRPLQNQYLRERIQAWENVKRQLMKLDFPEVARFIQMASHKDDLLDGAIQWQLMEDLDPKYRKEIRDYEATVERYLTNISHTSIGGSLLSMIKADAKVFIIPNTGSASTATTGVSTEAQGGGIRINFDPSGFQHVKIGRTIADEAEDTLFHELVHAMRMSNNRYAGRAMMNDDFPNTEEFIATQLENIFHAARRRSDTYSAYHGAYRKKNEMYQYLVENPELVMALKYFLQNEPLAKSTAALHQPDYNPFRDFNDIEQRSLKLSGLDKFNNF